MAAATPWNIIDEHPQDQQLLFVFAIQLLKI